MGLLASAATYLLIPESDTKGELRGKNCRDLSLPVLRTSNRGYECSSGNPLIFRCLKSLPKSIGLNRRNFLTGMAVAGAAAITGVALRDLANPSFIARADTKIDGLQKSPFSTTEKETPYKDVTNYNNFYEFSTDKYEPATLAKDFKTRPWTVTIDGDVKKKQVLDVDTIIKMAPPEERIYRHRCVEGWSIVVPWIGFSLSELINRADPLPKAKYVEFTPYTIRNKCPASAPAFCTGPTSKACAWMRPCIRWLCSASACMASRSPTRMAPRFASCSLEIRLQERQINRPIRFTGRSAPEHMEQIAPPNTASIPT